MSTVNLRESGGNRGRKGEKIAELLLIWTLAASLIPNVWLAFADKMPVFAALTNIVLPAGFYLWLLSAGRRTGIRSLCFIIIFVFAAFQMVLLHMYGRSIIAVDMFLNVVTTNSNEIGELLGNLSSIITVIFIVFLPPIIIAVISLVRNYRISWIFSERAKKTAWLTITFGLLLLGCCYLFNPRPYHMYDDLYPVNIGYNLKEAVNRTIKTNRYQDNVSQLVTPVITDHPDSVPETYVLVIGETSRGDNWQLGGYGKPTNQSLMNKEGLIYFPKALTESNTTHKSVPMLLSHLNAENFGDSIYHTRSLISAFKNAGFHTSFYSAQARNHSFIDFFGEEADTCVFIKESLHPDSVYYDTDLLKYLDQALKSDRKKKLIVLHSYGSHFNYIDRYPREKARFLPDGPAEGKREDRSKQINAYDNTISLTSDLLAGVIERLEKENGMSSMIYTSDHGEDIFDDDRNLFLHASPVPSYYQIHVPFIVWNNEEFAQTNRDKIDALKNNRLKRVASSEALYHTIMDLAGIHTTWTRSNSSLSSKEYAPSKPLYLTDHNKGVDLRDCGLREEDYLKLDSLGISY